MAVTRRIKPKRACPSCTQPFRAGKGRKVCDKCRLRANRGPAVHSKYRSK